MAREGYVADSSGDIHQLADIYVHAGGNVQTVTDAWVKTSGGVEQWWPPVTSGGGPPTIPPGHTVHVATLAGMKINSTTYSFITAPYKPHITHARLLVTCSGGLHMGGIIAGYPSGGSLGHLAQNCPTTKGYNLSAAAFNGSTHGVKLTPTAGTVTRVTLQLTYTT